MIMIPKYIKKKIIRNNELLEKAFALEQEVFEWYSKYISRFDSALEDSDLTDEDFVEISSEGARYISIDNIEYNINLLKDTLNK